MAELAFVKLGGSLITDKNQEATARTDVIVRLAEEIQRALQARSDLSLVLGHGSGSFGHITAERYHVQNGCNDWRGYAYTGAAANRLNRIVTDALLTAGVAAVSLQASASARCRSGKLMLLAMHPVKELLRRGLVPLVYGDVALDDEWGSTIISTEATFGYLARALRPQRIVLAGEVEGVFSSDPFKDQGARLIPVIEAHQLEQLEEVLGGSRAVDVTGGMRSKVQMMAQLVREIPGLRVSLVSGLRPGLLEHVLLNPDWNPGTVIMP